MKLLLIFTFIAAATVSAALAQEENSIEQEIRLTRAAVQIAQSELENSSGNTASESADAKLKRQRFNALVTLTLQQFSQNVQNRILNPFQALVANYSRVFHSSEYAPEVKAQLLTNLRGQLLNLAQEKEQTYSEVIQLLYAPLGSAIIAFEAPEHYDSGHFGYIPGRLSRQDGPRSNQSYFADVYVYVVRGNQQREKLQILAPGTYPYSSLLAYNFSDHYWQNAELSNRIFGASLTAALLEGCYTVSCYHQSLTDAITWASLLRSNLLRNLKVTLADGFTLHISKTAPRSQAKKETVIHALLAGNSGGALVANLPTETDGERFEVMARLQVAVTTNARGCNRVKDSLCRLASGCLTAAEKTVLLHQAKRERHSCLN